jgi:hypothetical protein
MRTHPPSSRGSSNVLGLLALLGLLAGFLDQACAQAQPADAIKTIGSCVVIQTNATTVEMPIGLQAVGSCAIAEGGDTRSCTAVIAPTGRDLILDVSDNPMPQCQRLAGDDPCTFVQTGPLVFQSPRHATQSFSVDSDAVRMTTMIRQKAVHQTTFDLPPSASFPLHPGRLFDVLRNRSAVAARLQCSMTDGDLRIFPIVGEADPSPTIRFVSKNSSEPTFDILTYRVMP